MKCIDRNGNIVSESKAQGKALDFLYKTKIGNKILKILVNPTISKVAGAFLDSRMSTFLIEPFRKKNNIDLTDFEEQEYTSFNDFFTRKIKSQARPIDMEENSLISPCDSSLSVYDITEDGEFVVKNTKYTMESLFRSKKLAKHYEGGKLLIFRLTVTDYHRFHMIDDGMLSKNYRIPGVLHTVNPIANDFTPIYKENTREFSFLKSKNFGTVAMMEVGALMVGRICNYYKHNEPKGMEVMRGMEKGRFEFGGSTVIIALEKDKAIIDSDILENSKHNFETKIKMGEKIGKKFK